MHELVENDLLKLNWAISKNWTTFQSGDLMGSIEGLKKQYARK